MNRPTWISYMTLPALLLGTLLVANVASAGDPPAGKIKITKLDDLPQHTYACPGKVSDMIKSAEQVKALAQKVRKDIEADMAKYAVGDASTMQRWHGTLQTIAMLRGDYEDAAARIELVRALEDKEAKKLTSGMTTLSIIAAKSDAKAGASPSAYKQAFRGALAKRVAKLPWDTVQDIVQQSKGRMEFLSDNLIMGMVQAQMDPVTAKTGELSADMAGAVIRMHFMMGEILPLKGELLAVYQEKIDANKTVKTDIWAARNISLATGQKLTPVLMAPWDSGTDTEIFKDRLFVNGSEKPSGKDDDGNGFVDDIHGIAYDYHARRTTGYLFPLGDAADRMSTVMAYTKGLMDLQAVIDSPEATALKKHMASLAPEDVEGFIQDLSLAGNYAHGTHVAGIMVEGNPFARLLIARHTYDYHTIPVARTVEWGTRDGKKCLDTVNYFKQHGVRVVNMSWGEAQKDAEVSLEANGIGASAEERRETARKVFTLQKEGLFQAIKNAPDILFVCAAGNADNDVEFDEDIPSSFDLPNLLVVGAVDQAGDPTSFTSFGRTVQVYANGFEVESYVPGGARMKFSGTSMASPNVANLAGKLLAIDPNLTPAKIVDLIKSGADQATDGSSSYLLMNPKKTIAKLGGTRP